MNRLPYFICFFLLAGMSSHDALAENARVAIIIDDIGYRKSDAQVLTLNSNITYAVLPHTPFGKTLAEQGYANNHEIMLHIPMESNNGKRLGPGALTREMGEQHIRSQLNSALIEIPFAVGINNHMGSYLTTQYQPMAWTMRYLKDHQLFFIDSMTTEQSKARRIAKHFGVPTLSRHVFLDNQLDETYIAQQFQTMVNQAQRNKFAIAIAHPHPETISALKNLLPTLAEHNITLVPISKLFKQQSNSQALTQISD